MLEILILELEILEEARAMMMNLYEDDKEKMIIANNAFDVAIKNQLSKIIEEIKEKE